MTTAQTCPGDSMPEHQNGDERFDRLERTVDRLEMKVDHLEVKIDERSMEVDRRFEEVGRRFEEVDRRFEKIDERFSELRNHFDVIAESWDSKFAMLYDFVKAQADKTDRRFEELTTLIRSGNADLRATIKLTYASLDRRVTALEDRARRSNKRQH